MRVAAPYVWQTNLLCGWRRVATIACWPSARGSILVPGGTKFLGPPVVWPIHPRLLAAVKKVLESVPPIAEVLVIRPEQLFGMPRPPQRPQPRLAELVEFAVWPSNKKRYLLCVASSVIRLWHPLQ